MRVEVEGGRIRRVEPCPDNAATPEGACLKGLSYVERVISPDRILTPLRRDGDRFRTVSWDDALDEVEDRLRRTRETFGPQSVLHYTGSGTKGLLNGVGASFWRMFGGCTTTYGDLCWPAGLEATRLTLGANEHNAPWDLVNARLIVLWGKNTAETNVHQMAFVDRAIEAGARLVVIDPRRTESAERADLLVRPRPGTDGALALGVANLLVREGKVDAAFVENHVHGFQRFRERAMGFPPDRVAAICDVPVSAVGKLAEWFGGVKPATVCAGFGMQRYGNSGQTMRAMIALLAITGNIGRPGAGWQFANLQSHVFDPVKDPVAFYPPERPDGRTRVSISTARLGRDMLATDDPPLRFAWVERGNPVTQNPEAGKVLDAFRRLDFRVVVDQFLTDTAREADIVLPAKTMFEQTDVITAYWHPYVQLKRKIIEPPGEVKPESEIYRLLAERFGYSCEDLPVGDEEVEAWLEKRLEPFEGLSLASLAEGPVVAPGNRDVVFEDRVFPTPSGKIELVSEEANRRWGIDEVAGYSETIESPAASKYPLWFMTPNTKNRIHSQFNNLQMIRQVSPGPELHVHPEDAQKRGVTEGETVRVFNDRGQLILPARLDPSLRRGCVSVTNGWWITEGGTVNFLSMGRETDMGHGASFHECLVEIEKAS
jgi:anaerobic selenocysteine-containing dehydrogenase